MKLSIASLLLGTFLTPITYSVPGTVVISEIMFDPLTGGAEYVELHNRSDHPLSLTGWKIYDATGKAQVTLKRGSIAPHGYLLVASDSAIYRRFPYLADSTNIVLAGVSTLSLNSDKDIVTLRDAEGEMIDEVGYLDDWHRRELGEMKGIALERISMSGASNDSRNWSSSAAPLGGTPGARNSLELPVTVSDAILTTSSPTLSPDGDGHEDFTRLSYRLPTATSRIVVTAHDRYGRPVRRIANNEPAAASGEVIWDGRDDDGRPLEPGIYLVHLEAYHDGSGLVSAKATIVIARRL
jgi:hypothetical protein